MFEILMVIGIIASVLLILIVLAQNPKGGINSQFGGNSNVLGVKKTTDFLEKATWGLAIAVFVISVAGTKMKDGNIATLKKDANREKVRQNSPDVLESEGSDEFEIDEFQDEAADSANQ